MTRKQRLELKLSELRTKLGGILDIPDDQRAETWSADLASAKTELRSTETEFQAAVLVEPETTVVTVDAEARERWIALSSAPASGSSSARYSLNEAQPARLRELQDALEARRQFPAPRRAETRRGIRTPGLHAWRNGRGPESGRDSSVRVPAGRRCLPRYPSADRCSG